MNGKIVRGCVWIVALSFLVGLVALSAICTVGAGQQILLEDDFSTDKGWTSFPYAEIVRNPAEQNVHWHVDRDWSR